MIIVADQDPEFRSRVIRHLGQSERALEVDSTDTIERALKQRAHEVTVVITGPSISGADGLRIAEAMQVRAPHVSVIFVASALSSDMLHAALRAGVRDVLSASFTDADLLGALERARAFSRQLQPSGGSGQSEPEDDEHRVVTVFSSKGGAGKSFVTSNLAVLLARRTGKDVALVDLDLQFGDLAIMLQLFPGRTIYEAAQNLDRLDAEALRAYLTPYRSQVHLLAAPLEPGLAETISAEAIQKIIAMLREVFPFVVIDTAPSFTEHLLSALDTTDDLVLITTMDVPSIKNLKLSLQTLELLGFGRERIKLVLNRADSKVGLRVQDVEKTLGTRVDVSIPSSPQVPLSINQGSPLVADDPRSPVALALGGIADVIGVPTAAIPQQPPHSGRLRLRRR